MRATGPAPGSPRHRAPGRRSRRRRRWRLVLGVVVAVCLVVAGVATVLVWDLYRRVDRVEVDLAGLPGRPPEPTGGAGGRPLSVGLIGTVDGHVTSLMVLQVGADRRSARFVSVPDPARDSGQGGRTSVPAAPSGAQVRDVAAVLESRAGLRIDHVAVFDWHVVSRLVDRLGGVDVYLPPAAAGAGWAEHVLLTGDLVPAFVDAATTGPGRQRPVDAELRRMHRQQRLLDTVIEQTLHEELARDPVGLYQVLRLLAGDLVIDDDWSAGELAGLVVSLRHLRSRDISYTSAAPR